MESVPKRSKHLPNMSILDVVYKFANVCRFRSIGVVTSENVNNNPHQNLYFTRGRIGKSCGGETGAIDGLEGDVVDDKVNLQLVVVENKEIEYGDLEILKLFDTVKALKLAYVQLQKALVPYDPTKICVADGLVISYLRILSKLKASFKEKQSKYKNYLYACSALLISEIQVQETLLENLKWQVKMKKYGVVKLRAELQSLESLNQKLGKQLIKMIKIPSFEEVAKLVAKAIHDFVKPLIALMKISGWDLDQAANVIESSVAYYKRSHKKFAFEAYIARRMFYGFTLHSYDVLPVIKYDDPIDALIEDPQSSFATYCITKYSLVVHPEMEASFFGNENHRNLVRNGVHPHMPFYRAFVKMAKWVWVLQGIASVVEPKVDIFRVKRGSRFSNDYMEYVGKHLDDRFQSIEEQERSIVEFMVMPGFKIGEKVLRSRVYVSS